MVGMVWGREMATERERTREWKGMSRGGRCRLGESALESGRESVKEGDADWERAHLIGREVLKKSSTGRERT